MEAAGGVDNATAAGDLLNQTAAALFAAANRAAAQQAAASPSSDSILSITDNRVTDSQLTTSLWLNALLGAICLVAFCILQRTVFPQHYRFRLVSASVTVKPRDLPTRGFYSLWAWLWTAWNVTDEEIMRSSGLDAMVMIKALQMGVEIFLPLALIGCAVLLPVHFQNQVTEDEDGPGGFTLNRSQLMQLTIAALPRGSKLMWLHFVLCIGYNIWAMYVMSRYFKDFVLVRQHYLSKGDDPNYWMALTQQADAEYVSKKVRKMLAEVNKPGSNPASGPGNGGPGHPPMPTLSTSPQPTERDASAAAAKQGWLGSVLKQAVQRMSRTNLFTRSSDSYRPYASELSPRPSGGGGSNDGSERMTRNTYLNWSTTEPRRHGVTATAAAAAATAGGGPQAVAAAGACEHLDSLSLRNSRDSSEGWAPGTAGGSESSGSAPASAAGGGAGGGASLGGGKRWSSGSSGSTAAAPHASEGGVTIATSTTGSSRGDSDAASAGGSGGGAAGALDSISRKLRLSGSKSGRRGEAAQQPEQQQQQQVPAGGTPPTYATISELHSVTAQADGSGGGISSGFWPSVPKHMRTITEDSLEYRLDVSLGASRPSSRGGHAGPAGARNSSSSGADVSPSSASTRGTSALSASLGAQAAAVAVAAGGGSSMDSSTPHAPGAGGGGAAAACSPSPLSRTSSAVPPSPLGGGFGAAAAAPPAGDVLEDGRGVSLAASMAAMQHLASREGSAAPRASVASLDSIDERSSVGTCIIHSSLPSSPGMGEGSVSNISSRSGTPGLLETPPDSAATGRDISFAGDALMGFGAGAGGGITLQGAFAAAAMPSSSSGNSGRNSCSNLGGGLEASLQPVDQGDVHISFLPIAAAAAAAGTQSAPGSSGGSRHHSLCESVDFSKAQLQDLSRADTPAGMDVDASNQGASLGVTRRRTTEDAESGGGSARWSPFAASDHIAGSIAAAGVAGWHELVGAGGGQEPAARSRSFSMQQQQGTSSRQQQQPAAGNAVQQQRRQSAQDGDSSRGGSFSQRRQQQQQAGSGNGSSSQHGLGRSCHGSSSNGSSSASGSSKLQRQRVQQPSRHSSSEPSPSSQTSNLPPGWSAGWQHQQGAQGQGPQLRCSSTTSRALSPVGGAFVPSQAQAVAGAAVGAGQELTPAALAAATGPGSLADAAADRLQRMLDCEPDAFRGADAAHGPFGGERRVAYHWWKELPADTLRKCNSLGSEQQAWQEYGDRPLLAKPSVRFRKTINTHKIGPDGREYAIAVNAQHYAVLVTDVQPCCPYPELEATVLSRQSSLYSRSWDWMMRWADRLTPRPRSWGIHAFPRRSTSDHSSWPVAEIQMRTSQEQQLLLLTQQQQGMPSDHQHQAGGTAGAAAASAGGADASMPLAGLSSRGLRRHQQLTACQTSCEGVMSAASAAAAGGNTLARLSQGSHLSHLSLLSDVRPDEQMAYLQQQIQWALQKLGQDDAAGLLSSKDRERRMAKILRVQADFEDKLAAYERMTTLSREASVVLPAVGRTTSHMHMSAGVAPGSLGAGGQLASGLASRASSFRSVGPRFARGSYADGGGAVAGAAVGNPEFASFMPASSTPTGHAAHSQQPTPRGPTPPSLRDSSETGGLPRIKERAREAAAAGSQQSAQQQRAHWMLSLSNSLPQRLQRMRVGGSARLLGAGGELDSGDLPLHMFSSASSNMLGSQAASGTASALDTQLSAPAARTQAARPDSTGSDSAAAHPALRAECDGMLLGEMSLDIQQHAAAATGPAEAGQKRQQPGQQRHHQRYAGQELSPGISPGPALTPASAYDPGLTPASEGRRDSFDSSISYAARRPVGCVAQAQLKPYPPDSPKAAARAMQQQLAGYEDHPPQPRARGGSSGSGGGGSSRSTDGGVLGHGHSVKASAHLLTHRGESAGQLSNHVHFGPSAGSSSLPPVPPQSLGSSGGGAGVGSSGGGSLHPTPPLPIAGRAKSARSSSHFQLQAGSSGAGAASRQSPDHLAVIIPPCPLPPPTRHTTPAAGSAPHAQAWGGAVAHMLPPQLNPAYSAMSVPPQPWGLPSDAALLTTSFGSSPAAGLSGPWGSGRQGTSNRAATVGGLGGSAAPSGVGQPHRWSAGGVSEQRSFSVGHPGAGAAVSSRGPSPLSSSEPDLVAVPTPTIAGAAVGTGGGPDKLLVGSRVLGGKAGCCVDPLFSHLPHQWSDEGMPLIPPHIRGWARVRWAYRSRALQALPKRESYDVVSATFSRLFPEDFDRAIPVISHREVDKLLIQWEAAVGLLERAELKRRRTGREPMRLTGSCGRLFGCCAEGAGCGGCCGGASCFDCCPESRTAAIIPELQERIQGLEKEIEAARRTAFSSAFTPSWFVLFKSQAAAMMAASTRIYAHDNRKFQVHPAPGPEEVNWQHIWMSSLERDVRTCLTWPIALLIVVFPIPLATSAVSRLDYVFCPFVAPGQPQPAFYWDWYCSGKEQSSTLQSFMRAFIMGWLPSLLLNLWLGMVLPRLVYLVVQMEGNCFSLSAIERRIGAIFFHWDTWNMFLQGTLGATFFQQAHVMIQSPERIPRILGSALPDSSNFFMQFIAMRALFLVWLRLCMPHGGVWQNWMRFICCPELCCSTCNTERDRSLTYGPRTPRYGFEMGHMLLMYLIALAFAIVSPLLLPFSVVWFGFAWLAWRHNLSYVYQRKYESGGMMWMFLFDRIVWCLVIGQLFTFCVLVVRGAYWQAFLIIAVMPAATYRYYRYYQTRYARGVEFGVPLDVAHKAARARVPALAYIPPPLQDRSWGWYPEWQKLWEGWGLAHIYV